jgi:hypothetical protein
MWVTAGVAGAHTDSCTSSLRRRRAAEPPSRRAAEPPSRRGEAAVGEEDAGGGVGEGGRGESLLLEKVQ